MSVTVEGVGVHSGRPARVRLSAGARGAGIRIHAGDASVVASPEALVAGAMQTRLEGGGASVGTVEHLLSACFGLGVWDLDVAVDGEELPIADGSALPWVEALRELGVDGGASPPPWRVPATIEVRDGDRSARLEPGDGCVVRCTLTDRGGLALLGPTTVEVALSPDTYVADIAWARTWAWASDAERLLAAGFGRGASAANTLLVGEGTLAGAPPRGPSEPVRHKILDALGDLALLGRPFRGRLVLRDSGHALHAALVREVARRT